MELYKKQVQLLLQALPEVAKEKCFALHGGTAINLFLRELPRLSVDIDLTYVPISDRSTSFKNINNSLINIKSNLHKVIPHSQINHKPKQLKILIRTNEATIKIEVNQGMRGTISAPESKALCKAAQEAFETFCVINNVPKNQLLGGKMCAALDRQHPRDLFDVQYILAKEKFTEDLKTGFIYCLLSSKRPIVEILHPNLLDQRHIFQKEFIGMTRSDFNYKDYESTRIKLIQTINNNLDKKDQIFLLSFAKGNPDWSIYDFEKFPSVQWKLKNLTRFKTVDPENHSNHIKRLEAHLNSI